MTPTNANDNATRPHSSIVIVGAGPRGTSLLERIVANAGELAHGGPVDVHVVDPFPPGGGRVWRRDQSPLLWMNTRASECTLFVDETVECSGPAVIGPDLATWARSLAAGTLRLPTGFLPSATTRREASRVHDGWFATRRLQSDYLSWVFWTVVEEAGPGVRVHVHTGHVEDIRELDTERQRVLVRGGASIDAHTVLLAQGLGDVAPGGQERNLAEHAHHEKVSYLARSFTADTDFDRLRAGEPVLLRGMGLAFVDVVLLLTQERGGRFHRDLAGALHYVPSGREPLLYAGSRRGVPYRAKFEGATQDDIPPPSVRRCTTAALRALGPGPLDFVDVRPLVLWDVEDAGYRALARGSPERVAGDPEEFVAALNIAEWGTRERAELIDRALIMPGDRVDLDLDDRPLAGRRFGGLAQLQEWMRAYIQDDLDRRRGGPRPRDLAVYRAVVRLAHHLADLTEQGWIAPAGEALGAFFGHARFLSSGPPVRRLEEVLALANAGILRFLGADTEVTAIPGGFRGFSSSTAESVETEALVEARLPAPHLGRLEDPLVVRLRERGELREHGALIAAEPATARLLRADGSVHPNRYGAGSMVAGSVGTGQFAQPCDNAPSFRQNDAIARVVLQEINPNDLASTL